MGKIPMISRLYQISTAAVLSWLVFSPKVLACAVCGVSEGEVADAFIYTTGLMTAAPLVIIGGMIYYIASKVSQDEDDNSPPNSD